MAQGSMGVADSRPKCRKVPFRDDFAKRTVTGVCAGLGPDKAKCSEIPEGIAFMHLDGHIHRNQSRFLKAFVDDAGLAMPKEHKYMFLNRSQTSTEDDKQRVSGDVACTPCTEFVHCVSAKPLDCGVINRLYSTGDNRSDSLGTFSKPAITSNIVMKVKNCERAVLLSNALVAVGGTGGPGVPAIDPSEVVPKANDLVPLNHHSHDLKEFEELLTCVNSKAAFELGAMDGIMCFQCICNKIPYFGITYSAALQNKNCRFRH